MLGCFTRSDTAKISFSLNRLGSAEQPKHIISCHSTANLRYGKQYGITAIVSQHDHPSCHLIVIEGQ